MKSKHCTHRKKYYQELPSRVKYCLKCAQAILKKDEHKRFHNINNGGLLIPEKYLEIINGWFE